MYCFYASYYNLHRYSIDSLCISILISHLIADIFSKSFWRALEPPLLFCFKVKINQIERGQWAVYCAIPQRFLFRRWTTLGTFTTKCISIYPFRSLRYPSPLKFNFCFIIRKGFQCMTKHIEENLSFSSGDNWHF